MIYERINGKVNFVQTQGSLIKKGAFSNGAFNKTLVGYPFGDPYCCPTKFPYKRSKYGKKGVRNDWLGYVKICLGLTHSQSASKIFYFHPDIQSGRHFQNSSTAENQN